MRRKSVFFAGNRQGSQCGFHFCGQVRQILIGFDAQPKDPRGSGCWKESVVTKRQRNGLCLNRRERFPKTWNLLFGLLSDEFERYVQRLSSSPSRLGSESTESLQVQGDAAANPFIQIKRDEDPH